MSKHNPNHYLFLIPTPINWDPISHDYDIVIGMAACVNLFVVFCSFGIKSTKPSQTCFIFINIFF